MTPNSDESQDRVYTWVWILESVAHWCALFGNQLPQVSVYLTTSYSFNPCTVFYLPFCWASLIVQTVKNCLQCRRPGFHPWVGKIPWRRTWQLTPVFLPGASPWTEVPGGLQSTGSQSQTQRSNQTQLGGLLCVSYGSSVTA